MSNAARATTVLPLPHLTLEQPVHGRRALLQVSGYLSNTTFLGPGKFERQRLQETFQDLGFGLDRDAAGFRALPPLAG